MISRLVVAALLAAVWVALWGEASPANILAGLAVGAGVQLLLGRHIGTAIAGGILRPVALARFTGVFAVELVVAAAQVAWEVVTPRNVDTPAVVEVDLATSSPTVVTAVANAVSLTPGTVTIEVNHREGHAPATLLIHVLHAQEPAQVRASVERFERLAEAALGPLGPPIGPTPTADVEERP